MRRVSEAGLDEIELIDVGTSSVDDSGAAVVSNGSGGWAPLALVAALGLGVAGLAVSGGDEATAPTASSPPPSVTVPAAGRDTAVTTARPASAPLYGDGPDLRWTAIPADVGTTAFAWNDGEFTAVDGAVEWTIRLADGTPIISRGESPLADRLGYAARRTEGAWILTPIGPYADHLLVVWDDAEGDAVRVDLPPPSEPVTSDLVIAHRWAEPTIIGDRVVVSLYDTGQLDLNALADRTDIDVPRGGSGHVDSDMLWLYSPGIDIDGPDRVLLADLGLSDDEIVALRRNTNSDESRVLSIDIATGAFDEPLENHRWQFAPPAVRDGELTVSWESNVGGRRSTTTDGVVWEHTPIELGSFPYTIDLGSVVYRPNGSSYGPGSIERSTDDGSTWQRSPTPMGDGPNAFAPEALFIGSPWFNPPRAGYEIPSDNLDLIVTLTPNEGWLTVAAAADPEVVLFEGSMWGEGGVQWIPAVGAHVIVDAEGATLARLRREDIDAAIHAERLDHDIAFGSWPLDADVVEWRRSSLREAFGDEARNVHFVTGDDAVLAVVITTTGYQLFVSPIGS